LFDLAVIRIDIDPVLHLGGLNIHWYGVSYAVAFYVALRFGVLPHMTAHGVSQGTVERMTLWTIVSGLVGARLYYVVQSGIGYYVSHPQHILAVWEGGMAFFGAIIAGELAILVLAWRNRLSFWLLADAAAIFGVLGQPIGRIGNIINGDILGSQSDLPWATQYVNDNAVLQSCCDRFHAYQPAAAYEALAAILIGVVLFALRRRGVRDGVLGLTYLALYAISQVIVFRWRISESAVALGLKQAQWTALGVLLVAVPLLTLAWRRGLLDWSDTAAAQRERPAIATTQEPEPAG